MIHSLLYRWSELGWILAGAAVLVIFALLIALPHRPKIRAGSQGHRKETEGHDYETVRPDGWIDTFANTIEEAGGSVPPLVRLAVPVLLAWSLIYLVLYWRQR